MSPNEIMYGFVDKDNLLLGTAIVVEGDGETIARIQNDEYQAVAAYPIFPEIVPPARMETFWDGTRFLPPKPYPSWIWNENMNTWISPITYPSDGGIYSWNEESASWVIVQE